MEVKILLLFTVQTLAEATKDSIPGSIGVKKEKAGRSLGSDEHFSATLDQPSGLKQAVRRAAVTSKPTIETTTTAGPCTVRDQNDLLACDGKSWIKGGNGEATLVDLSSMSQSTLASLFLSKKKIESISIHMNHSAITEFNFLDLISWTPAKEVNIVIADNPSLRSVIFKKLTMWKTNKKILITRNPKLTIIRFDVAERLKVKAQPFEVTKNPVLDEMESSQTQNMNVAIIRGNKKLIGDTNIWGPSPNVRQTTGECGFWEPISDFNELDGCTEIWDDVEFAASVKGTPPSATITKIDGNLKIVGTDLENLDFLDSEIVITGTVEHKDNLQMAVNTPLIYKDGQGVSKQILGWSPTTSSVSMPCMVINEFSLPVKCKKNLWLKGHLKNRTVVDLSSMNQTEMDSFFLNKVRIEDISIRLNKSSIVSLTFPNLESWTAAKDIDVVLIDNLNLETIVFAKSRHIFIPKRLTIARNPKLKTVQFEAVDSDEFFASTFEVTRNPSLRVLEASSTQTKVNAVIRGNRLLEVDPKTWKIRPTVHQAKGECGFWKPVSDFEELAGCIDVWDNLEFAASVTGTPLTSGSIQKVGGNLTIVGTDLKSLDFFSKSLSVAGNIEYVDNLEMPCDTPLAYNDNQGLSKMVLGWTYPPTTITTTTTTPGPSTTERPKKKKPRNRNKFYDVWLENVVQMHCMGKDGSTPNTTPQDLGCHLANVGVGVFIVLVALMTGCCACVSWKYKRILNEIDVYDKLYPSYKPYRLGKKTFNK